MGAVEFKIARPRWTTIPSRVPPFYQSVLLPFKTVSLISSSFPRLYTVCVCVCVCVCNIRIKILSVTNRSFSFLFFRVPRCCFICYLELFFFFLANFFPPFCSPTTFVHQCETPARLAVSPDERLNSARPLLLLFRYRRNVGVPVMAAL